MKKLIKLSRLFVVYHAASAALRCIELAHGLVTRFIAWNGGRL